MKKSDPAERRRAKRRPIIDTFSLFIVIPKKGPYRLAVHDVSELGLRFDLALEDEGAPSIQVGEELELHFYLNQSLFLPLSVRVQRVVEAGSDSSGGAELTQPNSPSARGFSAFLTMLDQIVDSARVSA